jgi:hypothetical protein
MGPIDTSIPPQQSCGHQTDPTPGDVLASITIGLAISYWSLLLTLRFTTTVPDLVTLCTYPTAPMFTCTSLPQTHDPCQPHPFLVHYTSLTCNHTRHMHGTATTDHQPPQAGFTYPTSTPPPPPPRGSVLPLCDLYPTLVWPNHLP